MYRILGNMSRLLLLLCFTFSLLASSLPSYCTLKTVNDSIEVLFKDTIHVRGKVADEMGNPLKAVYVSTGNYYGQLQTVTNADGSFLLKNVQPNDTLFFTSGYGDTKIFPEGSRIINVTLRSPKPWAFEGTRITATRRVPKELKNSTQKFDEFTGWGTHEVPPEHYGGVSKFYSKLSTQVAYPEKAQTANIEGMVKIEFLIDAEGKCTDFKTIQGLGYGCEEAVIEVLKETKWKPAIVHGHLYPMKHSVKVSFKLEDQ